MEKDGENNRMVNTSNSGLAGVIAGQSAISNVGEHGVGLNYRGYSIEDLTKNAIFEEVAYLLHYGKLPTANELNNYIIKLKKLRIIPEIIKQLLQKIPKEAEPMDMLRTACSMLGTLEPERDFTQQYDIADRLLALFPGLICYWYIYHFKNKEISEETDENTIGGHFLTLLLGQQPTQLARDMLNVSLILYAEHELNASTFAARITASTLSDFYSAITTAIGTLRGPLHGGANEAAMKFILQFTSAAVAEEKLLQLLKQKAKIMGFGHRVYKDVDPRSDIIKQWSYKLAEQQNNILLFNISERIEEIMWREKKLFPNLDFYSASAYYFCQIPIFLFTPIFVMSRITGWSAHIFEQRANNRLIRPSSEYIGPKSRKFIPLDVR